MDARRFAPPASAFLLTALAALAPAQENTWVSHGPTDAGVVNDVAVADGVTYAATPNGVFLSRDGGANWIQSALTEWIQRVVARPGATVVLAVAPSGLYVSRDVESTWAAIPGLPSEVAAIDPGQPSILYSGASQGIWRSTDSGASWQRLSTAPTGKVGISFAFDSHAVYVLGFDELANLYELDRSADGGVTWTTVSTPLQLHSLTAVAGGADPGLLYAAGPGSFCRSEDSAATFTCSSFPDVPSFILELPGGGSGAAPRILAGSSGGGVYVSSDGGATWGRRDPAFGPLSHVVTFASDASGSLLLASTNTGVFRSQDRGDSWTRASIGLRSSAVNALAVDRQDPSTVWAIGDAGLFRSGDAGLSWSLSSGPANSSSPFRALVIDPEHPSTLYAGGSAVYRSDDSGAHWTSSAFPGSDFVWTLAVDPSSPGRVWAGSIGGLFRTDDGARSWASTPAVAQEIYSILFDDKRPGTIYAGSYFDDVESGYYPGPEGGSIFVSRDNGASWTQDQHDFGTPPRAIASDPFHAGILYVGAIPGVFRSADDGLTWQGPGLGLPLYQVLSLVADPARPGHFYCVTDDGHVYRTIDGAQTWHDFSAGLGSFGAQALVISPDGKTLHAGTFGGGVFEFDLAAGPPSSPCVASATRLCLVGNRYAVDLMAARVGELPSNPGAARLLNDRAGYFALPFATGDPDLPEVVVKMLPEGTFGSGGSPVFYSSLTTLPYVLTVTDTVTGRTQSYASSPDAPLCGGTDLSFGASETSMSLRAAPAAAAFRQLEKGWVVPPEPPTLSLLGGRFLVALVARRGSGEVVWGAPMSSADRFGFFSLPDVTGDPTFPEVVVKMIDATALDGNYWFFHTGLTSLSYTLTVTDSMTTVVRTYESGTPFCGGADTQAFSNYFLEEW